MNRRDFCLSATAAVASVRASAFATLAPQPASAGPLITLAEIEQIDRERILRAANEYLSQPPITVTAASSPRSKGGKHDYFSEGDYWWPDPKNPGGPYIRRDGYSNPQNFNDHREALIRLSLIVPALTAAWLITQEKRYAEHAAVASARVVPRSRDADESVTRLCAGDLGRLARPRHGNHRHAASG